MQNYSILILLETFGSSSQAARHVRSIADPLISFYPSNIFVFILHALVFALSVLIDVSSLA